ncbi:MAG: hypothetical protein WBH16_04015 [Candidatus Nanopelagicales bacterium]|jgi:hypothetical protein|nr:hypothetical protein [Actinomycetes bacterium]MCH9830410.1 hypothetical protein [Actinomycetes bacterium]MCH9840586.1 hypothetical protein [Actinomycetes bacterium]
MENEPDLSTIIDGAGPIAGLFVLLVGIALVLLWLNMNRQMKRIDPNLPRSSGEVRIAQELDGIAQMEERAEQDPDAPKQ